MSNLIQIKRSTTNAAPAAGGLITGELAYSFLNTSNSLFVGDGSNNAIRIGGGNYLWLHQANVSQPGALTANAVVIVNGNSFTTAFKTNSLTVGADGATVAISNISTAANTTQLGASAGGANTELASTWAVKTYVDGKVAAAIPVLTSTYVGFGNTSNYLGGTAGFTFDSTTNNVFIANNLGVGSANVVGAVRVGGVVNSGNVTITGRANVSTTLAVTGAATFSNTLTTSGVANLASANVVGAVRVGGALTVVTSANVTTTLGVGGNTTITGFANVANTLQVTGAATFANNLTVTGTTTNVVNMNVSGNLTITGTLTTVNANNLTITDSMIQLASNNETSDVLDIGLFGSYNSNGGVHEHTGLFRDATDDIWKLFEGLEPSPTTTVDTSNSTFTWATLQTQLRTGGAVPGGLIANSTTIAITANSTLNVAIVANTLTLTTALAVASGGTGKQTFTNNAVLFGFGTGAIQEAIAGANGTVLKITNNVPAFGTLDGGTF